MASIVGHSLSSYLIYAVFRKKYKIEHFREWKCLSIILLLSIIPDFDVVLLVLANFFSLEIGIHHRGLSHSLLLATISSLTICGMIYLFKRHIFSLKLIPLFLIIYSAHLFLDYLMGAGPDIKPFAPFYNQGYLSPIKIIPTAHYSISASGIVEIVFSPKTWAGIILEVCIFLPVIITQHEKWCSDKSYLYIMSGSSVAATIVLYEFGLGGYFLEILRNKLTWSPPL
jgi:membrane-bound metal-dependent hydrolase YbcI (DUF457 family)